MYTLGIVVYEFPACDPNTTPDSLAICSSTPYAPPRMTSLMKALKIKLYPKYLPGESSLRSPRVSCVCMSRRSGPYEPYLLTTNLTWICISLVQAFRLFGLPSTGFIYPLLQLTRELPTMVTILAPRSPPLVFWPPWLVDPNRTGFRRLADGRQSHTSLQST